MAKSQTTAQATPSFSLDALRAIVATPEARELFTQLMRDAGHTAKAADTTADMDRLCIRAFNKAGFKDVQPRANVLTYNRWIEQGFRVKEGEKSIRVKNLRLFHRSQVEQMNAKDKAEAVAALAAKRSARTADKLPKVTPVAA